MMYSPILSGGGRKLPVSLDCVLFSDQVAMCAKVMFVPGTTSQVASVTVPTMSAVSDA